MAQTTNAPKPDLPPAADEELQAISDRLLQWLHNSDYGQFFMDNAGTPTGIALALALIAVAVLLALLLNALIFAIVRRTAKRAAGHGDGKGIRRSLANKLLRKPVRWLLIIIAVALVLRAALTLAWLPSPSWLWLIVALALIAAIVRVLLAGVDVIQQSLVARYRMDVRDNLKARRVHTQSRVLARTADVVIVVVGVATMLSLFESLRQIGTALLASAGVAGLIIGLAAKPFFENIIAGLQIALTQPINLDDVVIIENEWGWIEQITSTYVVVRIWDDRRLVVPLRKFIEEAFQNWTKQTSHLLGTVFMHVDYFMPLDELRDELKRLLANTDLWDGRVGLIQVTDAKEQTVQIRVLVSAADSPKLWDLRCYIREGMIRFLQRECPGGLPRVRASVSDLDPARLTEDERFEARFRARNPVQEDRISDQGVIPEKPSEEVEKPQTDPEDLLTGGPDT